MPTALHHSFTVAAAPEAVFAHLADPQSYVGLSPLVVRVADLQPSLDRHGRSQVSYTAVERFGQGRLHWDNRIRVLLTEVAPDRRLVSTVDSPGRVHLRVTVELAPTGTGTQVEETIDLRCPAVLRRFVVSRARAVQLHRAQELARRMAGRRTAG
jgi:uncharacterized protein YndB with AHSA1/START domain